MTGVDYAIVAVFLTGMALLGLTVSRLVRDADDLFVAGRELTPFILGATITATNVSMFHFVSMGGIASQSGVSIIWQNWTGDIALVLSGLFVLPALRRLRIRSIPEFLEIRYSPFLRAMIGIFWGLRLCLYLGIILYLAATAATIITGWTNYFAWLLIFSVVAILYSAVGGAWAVAIMDSIQFVMMLAGALVVLPIATHLAGGLPALLRWMNSNGCENHTRLVPAHGEFNWLFILAIQLLSFKWATVDQSILQRSFGARNPRAGAQGMVLAGIITTPLAFLWILPGLAMTRIHPSVSAPDTVIPWLLSHALPPISRGLLGFVLCGLVAAQISVITSDINSVSTLFTSDVFRLLRRTAPSPRLLLAVVRISSVLCGVLMIVVAWLMGHTRIGAVRANLIVVGVLDMPLFVITIVYGLFWRRTNLTGAVAGFFSGGLAAGLCYRFIPPQYAASIRNIPPIAGCAVALIVTPLASLLTRPSGRAVAIERSFESDDPDDTFHFIPRSLPGRLGLICVLGGFGVYLLGVLGAGVAQRFAAPAAVGGMIAVFLGGLVRVCAE